jgi:hypothetical protein
MQGFTRVRDIIGKQRIIQGHGRKGHTAYNETKEGLLDRSHLAQ